MLSSIVTFLLRLRNICGGQTLGQSVRATDVVLDRDANRPANRDRGGRVPTALEMQPCCSQFLFSRGQITSLLLEILSVALGLLLLLDIDVIPKKLSLRWLSLHRLGRRQ